MFYFYILGCKEKKKIVYGEEIIRYKQRRKIIFFFMRRRRRKQRKLHFFSLSISGKEQEHIFDVSSTLYVFFYVYDDDGRKEINYQNRNRASGTETEFYCLRLSYRSTSERIIIERSSFSSPTFISRNVAIDALVLLGPGLRRRLRPSRLLQRERRPVRGRGQLRRVLQVPGRGALEGGLPVGAILQCRCKFRQMRKLWMS